MESNAVIIADIIQIMEGHLSTAKAEGNMARVTDITKTIQRLKGMMPPTKKTEQH